LDISYQWGASRFGLGPLLFLIFINDLESGLLSSLLKFADDTKVFCQVNGERDRQQLQADLNRLTEWSEIWQQQQQQQQQYDFNNKLTNRSLTII